MVGVFANFAPFAMNPSAASDRQGEGWVIRSCPCDEKEGGIAEPFPMEDDPYMADVFTPEKRSEVMSRIRSRNTKPELALRSMLHRLGYRFTVNGPKNKALPGKPDIVLPKHHTVIFVHGCFWHGHENCRIARIPGSRTEWWTAKIEGNQARDLRNEAALLELGWHVVTVWECALETIAARKWLEKSLPRLIGR